MKKSGIHLSTTFNIIGLVLVLQLTACGGSGSSQQSSIATSSLSSFISSSESSSSEAGFPRMSELPKNFPSGITDALPVLAITTENSVPVESRKDYIQANFVLTEGVNMTSGTMEIRGRGNSTWDWPKKPYRMKLSSAMELLGMPSSKHWVLLANYADKTLMRNDIAFMWSEQLGMEYTSRAKYVEVNFNGSYEGVYQLVEHLRVAKDRINIPELKVIDSTADKITGGYLLEVDFRHHIDFCKGITYAATECVGEVNISRDEDYCIDSTQGMNPFCVDTPDTLLDNAWMPMREYITQYILNTESVLFSENFADPETGYAAYIDVDSAINYYLINELFKNVDGAVSSFYLVKKRDGKLFFGPIWDFDLALGNAGYDDVGKTYGWHIRKATWFARLFEDPAFVAKVKTRWLAIKSEGKLELIFQYANARAIWLNKMQAKNFERWPIFDWVSWYTRIILGGYYAEVNEMNRWQRERAIWMDSQFSQ